MSKYVLLIWEEIPESTKIFLIPVEVADEYKEYLEQAHGKFINCDEENDGMMFLNMAGADPNVEYDNDTPFLDKLGLFRNYLVEMKEPITNKHIVAVYLSGFML